MRRNYFGVRVSALPCEALVPQPCEHHSRGEDLFRFVGRQAIILHVVTGLVLRGPSLPVVYLGWPSQVRTKSTDCEVVRHQVSGLTIL